MDERIVKAKNAIRRLIGPNSAVGYNLTPGEPNIVVYSFSDQEIQDVLGYMAGSFPDIPVKIVDRSKGETINTPMSELAYQPPGFPRDK